MPLINIVNEFNKDNDGASERFEDVIMAANALWSSYQYRTYRGNSPEESLEAERQYALAAARAKAAASAYLKANQGTHFLQKGDRRYDLCSRFLVTLASDEYRPDPGKMGIGPIDEETPQEQWLAMAAEKEAETHPAEAIEDPDAYISEHENLDALLSPADFAVQMRLYERYFETRIALLSSPIYQKAKQEEADLTKAEGQRSFIGSHPEFSQEQRDRYAMLYTELGRLQEMGIGKTAPAAGKSAEYKHGRLGSKNSFLHGSFLKGSYKGDISRAAGVSGRLGKVGYRYKSSLFKFSPSLSVGGIEAASSLGADAMTSVSNTFDAVLGDGKLGSDIYSQGSVAKVGAYVARGQVKVRLGSKKNNLTVVPMVEFASANAAAKISKGTIVSVKGEGKDRRVVTDYGFAAAASAGASLLTYGGDASISFFGIKISLGVKAYVGAAKASAGATVTTGGIGFSLGAALGVGTEFAINIDWSGLKEKLFSSWRSKKMVSQERKEETIRENLGYSKELSEEKINEAFAEKEDPGPSRRRPSDVLDAASRFQNRLTETAEKEMGARNPVYRNVLHMADAAASELISELMQPEASGKMPQLMDQVMSSAVLANMIRVQRDMGITKGNTLENVIHTDGQIKKIMSEIVRLNAEQPEGKKYWSSGSEKEIADALSEKNLNRITKDIFAQAKKTAAPAPEEKENHHPTVQKTGNTLNFA